MPRVRGIVCILACLAALAAAAPSARANNGLSLIAHSTKSAGRGGAEAAVGHDVLTSISNPSTVSANDEFRFDGTLAFMFERVRTTEPGRDDLDQHLLEFPFPALGLAWDPFAKDVEGTTVPSRLRLAFAFWMPVTLFFSPTLTGSYRITDDVAVGVSVHPLITHMNIRLQAHGGGEPGGEPDFVPEGKVNVHYRPDGTRVDSDPGTPGFQPEPFLVNGEQVTWGEVFTLASSTSTDSGTASPTIKIDLNRITGFGLAGQVGVLWTPLPDLSIGASIRTPGSVYRPKGTGSIDLTPAVAAIESNPETGEILTAAFDTYLPARGSTGYKAHYKVRGTDIRLPPVFVLGAAWSPTSWLMLAADFKFVNWRNASSKIKLTAQKGTNEDFNEINGGSGLNYTVRLNFKNSHIIALGGAVAASENLWIRAGYNYGKNPVNKDFLFGNSIATEHHITGGFTYLLERWEVDFAYQYGIPTRVGDSKALLRSTSEQHIVFLGAGYRF